MAPPRHRAKWLGGGVLLSLALAGCNRQPEQQSQPVTGAPIAALQLATAPPPPPAYAPPASSLPSAPKPVAYRRSPQHWRYLTDAYEMSDAFADTPPDYTVDYEGEYPYVWRADDGAYRVVEWMPDGARYYYYEPGADEPFLIQDPDYSYAYDNGALVAVYTLAGALVADRIADERRDYAARYYRRGYDLYRAAVHQPRRAAYAANWQERAPVIQAQHQRWQQGREEQPGWRDWNRTYQTQQEARWAPERQHRQAYAAALQDQAAAGRGQREAQRVAEARPAPQPQRQLQPQAQAQPQPGAGHRPALFGNGNHPNLAERRAEGQHPPLAAPRPAASPPRLGQNPPRPALAQTEQRGPNRADHRADLVRQHQPAQASAQPQTLPQTRVAERQALAHAELAQRHAAAQAQQQQRHEVQRARQAQQREAQQAQQAEHRQAQQTDQAQHAQAVQAQHAQLQAERAQQRAQIQVQQHQEREAAPPRPATPHVEAPRAAPAPRVEAPHAQPPRPAPQQPHEANNGGDHKEDRRPH